MSRKGRNTKGERGIEKEQSKGGRKGNGVNM